MTDTWYFYDATGATVGPISTADLLAMAADGTISPDTLLKNGTGQVGYAKQIKGLVFGSVVWTAPQTNDTAVDIMPMAMRQLAIGAAFGLCLLGLLGSAVGAFWFLLTPSTEQIVEQPQAAVAAVAVAPIERVEPKQEEIDPGLRYTQLWLTLPDREQKLFDHTIRYALHNNLTFADIKRKHPTVPDELIMLYFQLQKEAAKQYQEEQANKPVITAGGFTREELEARIKDRSAVLMNPLRTTSATERADIRKYNDEDTALINEIQRLEWEEWRRDSDRLWGRDQQ